MILVSLLAATLLTGVRHQKSGLQRMEDSRAAGRLAESALISLQRGQPISQLNQSGAQVSVRQISPASDAPGKSWAQVDAIVNGRKANLIGLVPQGVIPATQPADLSAPGGTP